MNKSKIFLALSVCILASPIALAQTATRKPAQATQTKSTKKTSTQSNAKKTIKLDYESDLVTGTYDVPDASFINSRKMIKYKELFNKRTNFIDEIDANKGLFNEY